MSQKKQVSSTTDLKCLGCRGQKRHREDGGYFDYCGKTCHDTHLKKKHLATNTCPGCGKMKYPKGDGTYYDYCSKRCRDAHQSQPHLALGLQPQTMNIVPVLNGSSVHKEVSTLFQKTWCSKKGQSPGVDFIFRIQAASVTAKWQAYRRSLTNNYVEKHFHGTTLSCNVAATQQLCSQAKCGICGISKNGFVPHTIGSKIRFQRFGHGFYLAPNSSKCHDYTEGACGYRALLLCEVCPGRKHKIKSRDTSLVAPPQGYDSVYGITGGELNYEEIILYNPDAILPKYIIVYRKDGIGRIIL